MADEPTKRSSRVNVTIKVNLKYPNREVFVERFSQNISRVGIFVRDPKPLAVGSRVAFDYRLADNSQVLRGRGIVRWARPLTEASEPNNPPGMGIEFIDLDPATEMLVNEIVKRFGEGARAPKRAAKPPTQPPPAAPPSPASPPEDSSHVPAGLTAEALAIAIAQESFADMDDLTGTDDDARAVAALFADRAQGRASEPVVIDLAGADIVVAEAAQQFLVTPRLRREPSGALVADATGVWLPQLTTMLGQRWPANRAQALARRAGLPIGRAPSGGVGVVFAGQALPVDALLQAVLQPILAGLNTARDDEMVVIAPSALGTAGERDLARILDALDVRARIMPSSVAAVTAANMVLHQGQAALFVHLGSLGTEGAMVASDGTSRARLHQVAALDEPDIGFWDADELLLAQASHQLLRTQQIDLDADSGERAALRQHLAQARRSGPPPWGAVAAGCHIELGADQALAWFLPLNERLVLMCEQIKQRTADELELAGVVVAVDETPWPGAIEALQAAFAVPLILRDGAFGRVAGAKRSLNSSGAERLPNDEA